MLNVEHQQAFIPCCGHSSVRVKPASIDSAHRYILTRISLGCRLALHVCLQLGWAWLGVPCCSKTPVDVYQGSTNLGSCSRPRGIDPDDFGGVYGSRQLECKRSSQGYGGEVPRPAKVAELKLRRLFPSLRFLMSAVVRNCGAGYGAA